MSPTPLSWAARRFLTRTGSIQGAKPRGQSGRETHRLQECQQQAIFPGVIKGAIIYWVFAMRQPRAEHFTGINSFRPPYSHGSRDYHDLFRADEETEAQLKELVKAQAELGWDPGFPNSGVQALNPAGRTKTSCPALPRSAQTGRPKPRRGPALLPDFLHAGLSARKSGRWVGCNCGKRP